MRLSPRSIGHRDWWQPSGRVITLWELQLHRVPTALLPPLPRDGLLHPVPCAPHAQLSIQREDLLRKKHATNSSAFNAKTPPQRPAQQHYTLQPQKGSRTVGPLIAERVDRHLIRVVLLIVKRRRVGIP